MQYLLRTAYSFGFFWLISQRKVSVSSIHLWDTVKACIFSSATLNPAHRRNTTQLKAIFRTECIYLVDVFKWHRRGTHHHQKGSVKLILHGIDWKTALATAGYPHLVFYVRCKRDLVTWGWEADKKDAGCHHTGSTWLESESHMGTSQCWGCSPTTTAGSRDVWE